MHTVLVVAGGVVLLGVFLLIGKATLAASIATWALAFIPVWLLAAAGNMWFGVKRAGYTAAEEFPIFLVVFAVPAVLALLAWWWLSRR
ncbi:MAG: hypothetical protein WDO68_07550 [Gammaproteobacteria bacterium]